MTTKTDIKCYPDPELEELLDQSPLIYKTHLTWVYGILDNFDRFLADHASNERKAAAIGMELVVRYPDKLHLVSVASRIAIEEIKHFRQVFRLMCERNIPLRADEPCFYPKFLKQHVRSAGPERLLDQLLVNCVIEYRGMERFTLIALYHPEDSIRLFYKGLALGEKGHGATYIHEAKRIFDEHTVEQRLKEWVTIESKAISESKAAWQLFG